MSTFVDAKGREWEVRKVTEFAPDDQVEPVDPAVSAPFVSKTDNEIADDMRAIRLLVGPDGVAWEFREVHADVARVSAALAKDRARVRGYSRISAKGDPEYVELPPDPPSLSVMAASGEGAARLHSFADRRDRQRLAPSVHAGASTPAWDRSELVTPFSELLPQRADGVSHPLVGLEPARPRDVIGGENRSWVPHGQLYAQQERYATLTITGQPWPNDRRASGMLIGRSTAISAAHNFWGQSQSTWYSQRAWGVGVIRTGGNSPWTETAYGPWNGCYWVTIPTAWTTGKQMKDDWAVMDFLGTGCSITQPGTAATWAGFFVNASSSDHVTASSRMIGYDNADPLPPQTSVTAPYVTPSLITRDNGAWSTSICTTGPCAGAAYGELLSTVLDMTAGGSGSALLQIGLTGWPTKPLLVGTMGVGMTPTANYARRLDNNIWSFTQAYSTEW